MYGSCLIVDDLISFGLAAKPVFWHLQLSGLRPKQDHIDAITLYFPTEDFQQWQVKVFSFDWRSQQNHQVIWEDLIAEIHDSVIISKNARYYLSFIKNHIKRYKINWTPKIICLDRLNKTLGDENFTLDIYENAIEHCFYLKDLFLNICYKNNPDILKKTLSKIVKTSSFPRKLSPGFIENIPKSVGVYLFFDSNDILIYIGKSICLKDRIQSHFNAVDDSFKELQLAQQVQRIEWHETVGELGALLLESKWVKQYLPVYNKRLRKTKTSYSFLLVPSNQEYLQVKIVSSQADSFGQNQFSYGFFRRKVDALQFLKKLIQEQGMCGKWLGLNSSQKICFYHQIKQCRGACAGLETPESYNARLIKAMEGIHLKSWPYQGAIALTERAANFNDVEYHIFYQWKHIISVRSLDSLKLTTKLLEQASFDYDIYKLIQKALTKYHIEKVLPITQL